MLAVLSQPLLSQDVANYYESHDSSEEHAQALTKIYDIELGLRAEQKLLFVKKLEEYLLLSKEVKDHFRGKEMLDQLAILEVREIADMSDILTRIQWKRYKKIRPEIQPLARVDQ